MSVYDQAQQDVQNHTQSNGNFVICGIPFEIIGITYCMIRLERNDCMIEFSRT